MLYGISQLPPTAHPRPGVEVRGRAATSPAAERSGCTNAVAPAGSAPEPRRDRVARRIPHKTICVHRRL